MAFTDTNAVEVTFRDIRDQELILIDYKFCSITQAGEEIQGATILATDRGGNNKVRMLTWSAVLVDQLRKIEHGQLPLMIKLEVQGEGNRTYQTFV
tara:strand:+ start:131 stop:418 length:288 start_codon:yes stop_codon:yes gene_type:complete